MVATPKARGGRAALTLPLAIGCVLLMAGVARAQNLSYNELKLGVIAHDVHFLGGKERGIDVNPEVIFQSPVADSFAAGLPWYIRWTVQPRPTLGAMFNTSRYTNQYYFGATWSWLLADNLVRPGDGIVAGLFFGPGFNDGDIVATRPDRKSLGGHVLFREAVELGYRFAPRYQVSAYIDHVSNAGFDRYNQSLNDVGVRLGIGF